MVRSRVLGLAVAKDSIRAALVERGKLAWVGGAEYQTPTELTEAIARLASEAGRPVRRARIALGRDVVQLRTIHPAPPLKARDVRRYVGLEAARLFRKNGEPLVTDGALVTVVKRERALWAAAAPEPLLSALLDGCAQAGLAVEALAPSADTLAASVRTSQPIDEIVIPNGSTSERLSIGIGGAWRSRWTRGVDGTVEWMTELAPLNGDASSVAPAFAAAIRLPTLTLIPEGHRRAAGRTTLRRHLLIAGIGVALWVLAGGIYVGRLSLAYSRSTHLLEAFRSSADSALAVRRDLDDGRRTLATIAAARASRSRTLPLLAEITRALPDSVALVAFRVGADGVVRIVGYAPRAAQVLAEVARVRGWTGAALDGPVTQEAIPSLGVRDRFSIVAKVRL